MCRRALANTEWPLTAIVLVGVWVTSCAEKGPVDAPDASVDTPDVAFDAPPLDAPVEDIIVPEDTWYPDLGAWLHLDAITPDYPPPPDIPLVPTDVPRCVSQSVVECVCPDGRSGLQPCLEFGYYGACRCVAPPPPPGTLGPRLLRPFSGLRSMTQRPTFAWVLPEGVTRARVELCDDRVCTRRITQTEVTGSAWRPTEMLRPGVVFWHVLGLRADGSVGWTSATWEVGIRHRDTPVDSAWGPLKDFNGDGLDDLVAIAYHTADRDQDMSGPTPGIYVVPGSRTTFLGTAVSIQSDLTVLGRRTAIGDVNGDGLADVAFSALTPNRGSASIYLGRRDGVLSESAVLLSDTGGPFDFAGGIAIEDFNGDGFGDLLVFGARIPGDRRPTLWMYPGSSEGIRSGIVMTTNNEDVQVDFDQNNQQSALGDLDGDGYGDVASVGGGGFSVITYGNPGGEPGGRVSVVEFANVRSRRRTGMFSMDIDGDKIPDLAMGYPRRIARGYQGSLIRVQELPAGLMSGEDRFWTWHDRSRLSRPVDYDGDGRPDLAETLLCQPGLVPDECRLTVLRVFRSRDGFFSTTPDWQTDVTTSTFAGSPGDLNGDGFDDLVVSEGTRLTVYLGRMGELERQPTIFTTAAPIQHASQVPLL